MSRSHHQSREEQINNRIYAAARLNQEKISNQKNMSMSSEHIQRMKNVDEGPIQPLAFQIHSEKRENALDNWKKAVRYIRNNDSFFKFS